MIRFSKLIGMGFLVSLMMIGCGKPEISETMENIQQAEEALPEEAAEIENTGRKVSIAEPAGIMVSKDGSIYVADKNHNNVVQMEGMTAYLVAGKTLPLDEHGDAKGGYADGNAADALFAEPFAMASWGDGIAVSDMDNHCIRLIMDGLVRTLAGTSEPGYQDGYASEAAFYAPAGLAADDEGNLYIADSYNGKIRCLSEDGSVSTVISGLEQPMGLCWNEDVLYIADAGSHQILKMEEPGEIQVVAGISYGEEETDVTLTDGSTEEATFCAPHGLEVVGDTIYVADTGFAAIRKIENGMVSTLKRSEGTGSDLWPSIPMDLAWVDEKLYVSDAFHGVIFTVEN